MTDDTALLRQQAQHIVHAEDAALFWSRFKVWKKSMMEQVKAVEEMAEEALLEFIGTHGSFEIGGIRYYAGNQKIIKVRDKERAVEAVLEATGGDLEDFVACLVAQPLKTGECRQRLGDAFGDHFAVEIRERLKEGKPRQQVMTAEAKYLKR